MIRLSLIKRIFSERNAHTHHWALIERTGALAASARSLSEFLTRVAEDFSRALNLPRVAILLRSDVTLYGAGEFCASSVVSSTKEKLRRFDLEIAHALAAERLPVQITATSSNPALQASFNQLFNPSAREPHIESIIFTPLLDQTKIVGALVLYRHEQRWTTADEQAMRALAACLCLALRDLQSREAANNAVKREALTHDTLAAIRSAVSVDDILKAAVDGLGKSLGVTRVVIFKRAGDRDGKIDRQILPQPFAACAEYRESVLVPSVLANRLDVEGIPFLSRLLVGEMITLPDISRAPAEARAIGIRLGVCALALAPIAYQNHTVAALALEQFDHPREFSDEETKLIQLVSEQTAVALYKAELFREAQESARRESFISHIAHGINQSNQLDEIFQILATELGKHLRADRLIITRLDEDAALWVNQCVYSEGQVSRSERTFQVDDFLEISALAEGGVIRSDDTENDPRMAAYLDRFLRPAGTRAFLIAQVAYAGKARLAMNAVMTTSARCWTSEEIDIMRAAADQSLIALQRAELFEQISRGKYEWEATFDAITDGILIFDKQGILRRVNEAGARFEGALTRDLVGRKCCTLMQGIEGEVCRVAQVMKTGQPVTFELVPERLKRPVLVTISALKTGAGGHFDGTPEPRGAACIVRDLSELRAAEADAREQRNFLVKLIEHANDAIYALSPEGRLIWFNEQLLNLSGYTREELNGRSHLDLAVSSQKAVAAERFTRALTGEAQTFEVQAISHTGQIGLMLVTFTPIYDDDGVTSVLAIARNITEERMASERAAQADKLRALGQLASGVAHSFNNILAAILGHAQLVKRECRDERAIHRVDIIEKAALDGAQTVKRIQGFGLKRTDEVYQPLDLNQLVQDSTNLTRARWSDEAQARGLFYEVELDLQPLPITCGAASELSEVFVNLILNALDAMPQGGKLRVTTEVRGGSVRVSFKDNGIGMTHEMSERIFEPFFTTKGTTGMGLGLAVSYSIIERHGGRIETRSRPGHGTTFSIKLPIGKTSEAEAQQENVGQSKAARVLVIDDDERVREALVGMLELAGHCTDYASNGREAIAKLERERFDLVFTDLSMPETDGWAVAREIRTRWPAVKIVMVTGYAVSSETVTRHREIVNQVIAKPLCLDDINTTLNQMLA